MSWAARCGAPQRVWEGRRNEGAHRERRYCDNCARGGTVRDNGGRRQDSSGASPPHMIPTACAAVLEYVLHRLRPRIDQASATVTRDVLPAVLGDPQELSRLFYHLLDNGLKFRSEEPPKLHVGAEQLHGHWLFSVRDNGIGMSGQCLCCAFAVSRQARGSGGPPATNHGLADCKKIVDRHGGRLWVQSKLGTGSTVYFAIPMMENARGRR